MQPRSLPEGLRKIVSEGVDTSGLTTWGVGGVAKLAAAPKSDEELRATLEWFHQLGSAFAIVGGGSNLLIADGEIETPLLLTSALGGMSAGPDEEDEAHVILDCGAGVEAKSAFALSLKEGWSGLEQTVGIPGTVGGAAIGNAGTRHGAIGQSIHSVRLMGADGRANDIRGSAVDWGYRYSSLAGSGVLSRVRFRLVRSTVRDVREAARTAMLERRSQPVGVRTAGCVFKNPLGYSAGQLIDEAGCKGMALGGACVSSKHANFFENRGGATARDILALIDICRELVQTKFGVELQLEIKLIGFPREVMHAFGQTS